MEDKNKYIPFSITVKYIDWEIHMEVKYEKCKIEITDLKNNKNYIDDSKLLDSIDYVEISYIIIKGEAKIIDNQNHNNIILKCSVFKFILKSIILNQNNNDKIKILKRDVINNTTTKIDGNNFFLQIGNAMFYCDMNNIEDKIIQRNRKKRFSNFI